MDCGKYLRRLISYASEPGSRVPAYLLVPKAALVEGAAEQRAERHGRVGCGPAADRDLSRGDGSTGQDPRVHVLLEVGSGPNRDRFG